MRAAPTMPCRVAVAGAELDMLVLAADRGGCVGVDLGSGAFVRARYHGDAGALAPFDVVVGEIATSADPPDASRPETVALTSPPRPTGQMSARRAERWLAPLRHPPRRALFGFPGPAVPYWTLTGDRPSVTLLEVVVGPHVLRTPPGYECRFTWQGARHQLPLGERRLAARLDDVGWPRFSPRELDRLLGWRVRHLLVALSPPHEGYCYKVVAALLPG